MSPSKRDQLIAGLESANEQGWGPRALLACLITLRDGGPTETAFVTVHDAWAGADEFRVVYTYPATDAVGVIRRRDTRIDFVDAYSTTPGEPTPEEFGREVADFNIGEPLGAFAEQLDFDDEGLGWWGHRPLHSSRIRSDRGE